MISESGDTLNKSNSNKTRSKIFLSLLISLTFIISCAVSLLPGLLPAYASGTETQTGSPQPDTVPSSTPAEIGTLTPQPSAAAQSAEAQDSQTQETTQSPDAESAESADSTAGADAASGTAGGATPYDGSNQKFDATPDKTGNSGGQIAFMLIIFLVCLFFVIEAVVRFFIKKKKT